MHFEANNILTIPRKQTQKEKLNQIDNVSVSTSKT